MKIKNLIIAALMLALVFLVTYLPFLHIPSPIAQGYFNVGDAVIMAVAILFGKKLGFFAGAFGSALADLMWGSLIFAPITFVVKGVEGFVVGLIANKGSNKTISKLISVIIGAIIMVFGYFIFELTIVRLLDKNLAVAAIISEVFGNLIQGGVSAILAYFLSAAISQTSIMKNIKKN